MILLLHAALLYYAKNVILSRYYFRFPAILDGEFASYDVNVKLSVVFNDDPRNTEVEVQFHIFLMSALDTAE
jgi:hypothetical protein